MVVLGQLRDSIPAPGRNALARWHPRAPARLIDKLIRTSCIAIRHRGMQETETKSVRGPGAIAARGFP